jgi:exodeoxyribonuclease VII large subunit
MRTKPQEGLEIIATGKVSTFPGKSTYQLIIESIEPAGIGALMALFEERRRRLAAEGLFDEARKQLLPFLPQCIGVVTSPTGSVIRDILHRIADRFPRHILVWPVRVQGETSAAEVTAAIEGFNLLPEDGPLRRPDLIIVARGGGSLEDLWGFNEETVVRAAASSLLPLISAIGHETDWTLIDYAADLRAPTPTGAAEKAVPVRLELLAGMADLDRRHQGAILRLLDRRRAEMRGLARALPQGDAIVALPRQRLDRANTGLAGALTRGHDRHRIALARLSHRLAQQSPHAKMARAGQRLEALEQRLRRCLDVGLERRHQGLKHAMSRLLTARVMRLRAETEKLSASAKTLDVMAQRQIRSFATGISIREARLRSLGQLLQSLGYRQVLARGFALVRDAQGQPLRLASQMEDGDQLNIEFADGRKSAVVGTQAVIQARETAKRPADKVGKKSEQGTLF